MQALKIRLKIGGKLIIIIIVAMVLSTICREFMRYGTVINDYEENLKNRVVANVNEIKSIISELVDLGLSLGELKGVNRECAKMIEKMPMAMYCLVMDKDRIIKYHNNPYLVGSIRVDSVAQKAIDSQEGIIQKFKDSSGAEVYDVSIPIIDNLGTMLGVVSLGVSAKIIKDQLAKRMIIIYKATLISMLIAVLLVFFLTQYSIIKNIRQLIKGIVNFSLGNLDFRINVKSSDEIGELAQAFNQMAENLKKTTTSIFLLNKEVQEREKIQQELTNTQLATLNIMEDLQEAYNKLKDTQSQLIQMEKMSALGVLSSGVAHEVKNPLGIIIQATNYLEGNIDKDREDMVRVVGMIKEAVTRADNIIRGLLDYSRVSALSLKAEDVNTILENSLNLVRHRTEFEKVRIIDERKNDIPKALVDKNKLQQVFINLFTNASQAMSEEGGDIILRTFTGKFKEESMAQRRLKDFFVLGEGVVLVEIEDTGKGISKENLPKIFDPFFSTKDPRQGAGLGLSICANIIDMHKGYLDVESQEGKGTKFTLTLKIAKGQIK